MALILNDEQLMLRDSARDFLKERAPVSHLRSLRDDENSDRISKELWAEMASLGWPAILVPEQYGGLDYGHSGLGIVIEETGRTLTPTPLLSTALTGVTLLKLAGSDAQKADLLPRIAGGQCLTALACDESSRHQPEVVDTRAVPTRGGYILNGNKRLVLDGHIAEFLIVSARTENGITLFLVPANTRGVTINRVATLDIAVTANVDFEDVNLDAADVLGTADLGAELLEKALDTARVGVCAELLGLAQEAFERTMDYLKVRKQFGVPIGVFQGLQHRAAKLYADIELCKSLVIAALQSLDETPGGDPELVSATKARLCSTAHRSANEAIQMHGGIGMTDEFEIGFFLKRCQILEALYGDRYYHSNRFARLRNY